MTDAIKYRFGLIGTTLKHSFSKRYHNERFEREFPSAFYELYELRSAAEIFELFRREPSLVGLNVTIPFKEAVIPLLNSLDPFAEQAGAVNTIVRSRDGLLGFNTDIFGFVESLRPHLKGDGLQALVFGTGGGSKAVRVGLDQLGIKHRSVSRTARGNAISYSEVTDTLVGENKVLINCTPVGMYPEIDQFLPIPYSAITPDHIVFDLVYNPEKTVFLERSESNGATIVNGLEMLHLQADRAWEIWRQHLDIRI